MSLDVLVLPDPELVLADDWLPATRKIVAMSAFIGGEFTTKDRFIRHRKQVEDKYDAEMHDWQRAITVPCKVRMQHEELILWGDCPEYRDVLESDRMLGAQLPQLAGLRRRLEDAARRGWLYGRWYSMIVPEGEWGAVHRALIVSLVSSDTFIDARFNGWPLV